MRQRPLADASSGLRRNSSLQNLQQAMLGPSQRAALEYASAGKADRVHLSRKDAQGRSLVSVVGLVALLGMAVVAGLSLGGYVAAAELPSIIWDLVTFTRTPIAAQDNVGSILIILLCLVPICAVDWSLCRSVMPNPGSRWFLLHAIGNMFVCLGAAPDFYYLSLNPPAALSVEYCRSLPFPACTEWPVCIIVALHLYHMVAFDLSPADMFHHVLFVPVIGGIHFLYPWGAAGNILSFFISGFPGGLDYFMLAAVKAGKLDSFTEKRINCSINTWIRGPGITAFITICTMCWLKPYPGTPETGMPSWLFVLIGVIVFFNGQHYAQRVIGNYYIKKAQDYQKKGKKYVDLHAS